MSDNTIKPIHCESAGQDFAESFAELDSNRFGVFTPSELYKVLQARDPVMQAELNEDPSARTYLQAKKQLRAIHATCPDLFESPIIYRSEDLSAANCATFFQKMRNLQVVYDANHDGIFDETEKAALFEDADLAAQGQTPQSVIKRFSSMDPGAWAVGQIHQQDLHDLNQFAALHEVCPSFDENLTYETKPQWKLQLSESSDWALLDESDVGSFPGLAELIPFAQAANTFGSITTPNELKSYYHDKLKSALKTQDQKALVQHHRFVVALARLSLSLTAFGSARSFFSEVMRETNLYVFHQHLAAAEPSVEVLIYRALRPYQKILRTYDTDQDGWLKAEELEKLQRALQVDSLESMRKFVQAEEGMVSAQAAKEMQEYMSGHYALANLFQTSELGFSTELFFENKQFGIDLDGDGNPELIQEDSPKIPGLNILLKAARKAEDKNDADEVVSVDELQKYYASFLSPNRDKDWIDAKRKAHDDFVAALLSVSLYVDTLENGRYLYAEVMQGWSINRALQHPETFREEEKPVK